MSTIKELLSHTIDDFTQSDIPTPTIDAEILLSHFLQIDRTQLYLDSDTPVTPITLSKIKKAIAQRVLRKPLQYIIGQTHFLNQIIKVDYHCLIPRPETEFMVDYIIKNLTNTPPKTIIDLCTGSGCIAIALKAHFPQATVSATDISFPTLLLAQQNASNNHVSIQFIECDVFPPDPPHRYDLIVTNPPYVSQKEYDTLQPEIYFEPKIALVAKRNGLYYMDLILQRGMQYLSEGGVLYMEIAESLSSQVRKIAIKCGYSDVDIIKDLCEKDRILRCKR